MNKKFLMTISFLAIFVLVLSSCTTATVEPKADEVMAEPTAEATEVMVEPTAVVTEIMQSEATSGGGNGDGSGGGSGTGGGETSSDVMTGEALKITGKFNQEIGWSEEEIKAMPSFDVESTNSKGDSATYTGVLISDLLNLAGLKPKAETLVFVADDGFTAEIGLADVMSCTDCILSFRSKGGFSSVLPGFEKNLQVKGVIELNVK